MKYYDVVILTDKRFVNPTKITPYINNVILEDTLLMEAFERKGFNVVRLNWDFPHFDWEKTKYAIFRTTWDYFNRFNEFSLWLKKVSAKTKLINPISIINWNIDKHYLLDLKEKGINIPETVFIEKGDEKGFSHYIKNSDWDEFVLKPSISGAGRHTYRINRSNYLDYSAVYNSLIQDESLMLQEFQYNVVKSGEIAFILFGGNFSHAILKKAKPGEFRVQDDFGGTVQKYHPTIDEIKFAENVVYNCDNLPLYARVDVIKDNTEQPAVSELELIEPELWFRYHSSAADSFVKNFIRFYG